MPERYEYEFHSPGGLEPVENRDWWAQARCNDLAGTMSGLFFSEELQDIAKAKQIEPGIGLEPMVLTSPAAAKIMVIELAVMR